MSEETVLGWIRTGQLKAMNVGRTPGAKQPRRRVTKDRLTVGRAEASPMPTPAKDAPKVTGLDGKKYPAKRPEVKPVSKPASSTSLASAGTIDPPRYRQVIGCVRGLAPGDGSVMLEREGDR